MRAQQMKSDEARRLIQAELRSAESELQQARLKVAKLKLLLLRGGK